MQQQQNITIIKFKVKIERERERDHDEWLRKRVSEWLASTLFILKYNNSSRERDERREKRSSLSFVDKGREKEEELNLGKKTIEREEIDRDRWRGIWV